MNFNKCEKCLGKGFIKIETIYCSNCKGDICYLCERKGGIIKGPWIVCDKCHTTGKIIIKNITIPSKSS